MRLRHPLLVIRPTSTSLIGICPNTTSMKATATARAAAPVSWYMSAKNTACNPATNAKTVRTERRSTRYPTTSCAKAAIANTRNA